MNKVILIGRLTKDPELITTGSGISVCRFALAIERKYANADGEKEVDFLNIVAWRGLADNCNKYLRKGNKCGVVGSIQTRSYVAADGTKKYLTEIIAEEIEFLSPKTKNENKPQTESQKRQDVMKNFTPIDDSQLPF